MSNKYAFIGFGALGEQMYNMLPITDQDECVYFDDNCFELLKKNSFPFGNYNSDKFSEFNFLICLGYKHSLLKKSIYQELKSKNRKFITIISNSCFVNTTAVIGVATTLYPMCNVDSFVKIGEVTVINNSVVISHNSSIGDFCYISPGTVISGYVNIGNSTFIGSNATIANNVTIGNNVIIGVGTVVTKDIPDNSFVIGNPMRFVKNINLS